jgi:Bacterial CdiA-CT RNAse A domain
VEEHVRKSDQWLLNDVRSRADSAIRKGDYFDDFRSGSFTSLESANKLVNATIAANQGKVDRVVLYGSPKETLDYDFDTPTGREAYMPNERSQAVMRYTYSVRVVIVPDSSEKGYRVLTAFPRNR